MGGSQDHHQRPGAATASRGHRRPGDEHDHGQGRSEEPDRRGGGSQRKRKARGQPAAAAGARARSLSSSDARPARRTARRSEPVAITIAAALPTPRGRVRRRPRRHVRARRPPMGSCSGAGCPQVGATPARRPDYAPLEGLGSASARPHHGRWSRATRHGRPQRGAPRRRATATTPPPPRWPSSSASTARGRRSRPGREAGGPRRARGQARMEAQGQPEHGRRAGAPTGTWAAAARPAAGDIRRRAGHQHGRGQGARADRARASAAGRRNEAGPRRIHEPASRCPAGAGRRAAPRSARAASRRAGPHGGAQWDGAP